MKKLINTDSTINPISDIYKEYFENELLRDTEDFYRQQTIPDFESNSTTVYLIAVRTRYLIIKPHITTLFIDNR